MCGVFPSVWELINLKQQYATTKYSETESLGNNRLNTRKYLFLDGFGCSM